MNKTKPTHIMGPQHNADEHDQEQAAHAYMEGDEDHALFDCGCCLERLENHAIAFRQCSVHDSLPELLEVVKRLDKELSVPGDIKLSTEDFLMLRVAIAKAKL